MKRFVLLSLSLFLVTWCRALSVLVIGNSYSRDAFSYVPSVIEELCPDLYLDFKMLYMGGVTLNTHLTYIKDNNPLLYLDEYDSYEKVWRTWEYVSGLDVISSYSWDLIIFQEGGNKGRHFSDFKETINSLLGCCQNFQCWAKYAFMLNPTHPLGNSSLGDMGSDNEWILNVEAAKSVLNETDVEFIIPCGTAIQNARRTYMDSYGAYGHLSYDGNHLQEGIPCLIEAYAAAQKILDVFGYEVSIGDCEIQVTQNWVKEKNIPGQHGGVVKGSKQDYDLAKRCAVEAVKNPYSLLSFPIAERYPRVFKPDVFCLQAQGGFSEEFPENTLIAFEEAGKSGAFQGLQTDVQATNDGILVCIHDQLLSRTTGMPGAVGDYDYDFLSSFNITGGAGWDDKYECMYQIPTFDDYVDICKKYQLIPYVNIVYLPNSGIKKIVETLHNKGFEDGSYVLLSSNLDYLKYAANICNTPLEYIKSSFSDSEVSSISKIDKFLLRPNANSITKKFVSQCNDKGILLECNSINIGEASKMEIFKEWGVKGASSRSWMLTDTKNGIILGTVKENGKGNVYDLSGINSMTMRNRGVKIINGKKVLLK